ncbi:MAG: hypothetical protein IJQ53_08315 [Clostridia bacterium]|nr:hypothetical protein [Clostridia bacterium]
MKRAICILTLVISALVLAACGSNNAESGTETQSLSASGESEASVAEITSEPEESSQESTGDGYYLLYKKTYSNNGIIQTTVYDYDLSGLLIKQEVKSGNNTIVNEYTYDENGNKISDHYKSANQEHTTINEYDENNNCVKGYTLEEPESYQENEYDANGKHTRARFIQNGAVLYEIVYTYNEDGSCTLVADGEKIPRQEATYDKDGKPLIITSESLTISYEYDDNGNTVKIVRESNGSTSTEEYAYEYSENGEVLKKTSVVNGDTVVTEYIYDDVGNILKETARSALGATMSKTEYEYKYFPKG